MAVNQNVLVKRISEREGKKVEVNIAQIKEVVRLLLEELAGLPASQALALIERHAPTVTVEPGRQNGRR